MKKLITESNNVNHVEINDETSFECEYISNKTIKLEDFKQTENVEEFDTIKKDKNEKSDLTKNVGFKTRICNFLFERKTYCYAFSIFTAIYLLILFFNGVFSGEKTIFVSDSYCQVGVFFSHIFKFLRGETSLFYTNVYGKGFEIFSTLQYMYFNPFYLIVLLGGEKLIYQTLTVSVYFMLVFSLFVFIWFSEKYFKNINDWLRVLLALMYVFCPFLNFNYSFISWFIYPSITLILIDRFLNFLETKKILSFIVVFTWYVVSCFSVGISTAIILFVLFMLYIYIVVDKENRKKYVLDLFVVFVSTALISVVLLMPSIIDVFASGRTNSFLYNLLVQYKDYKSSKLALFTSDYLLIAFSIYYFIKCNKKEKINKYLFISFIIVYIPIIFDSVMKILCFSTYNGFVGRFYFLNEVAIFIPTLLIFDKKMWKFNECNEEKYAKVLMEFLMTLMILFIVAILLFNFQNIGLAVKNPLIVNIGVAKINLGMLIVSVIFIGLALVFNWRKIISGKFIKSSFVLLMIISLCFNVFVFIGSGSRETNERYYIANTLKDTGIEGNIKYFNICDASYELDNLDNLRQTSVFSSLTPSEIINSYKSLGYLTSNASFMDNTGSLLSDSFNGIRYYLSEKEMKRPYLREISLKDNSKYHLYENILATNGTFVIDKDFSFDNISSIENFEKLKNYYGIEGTLFEDVEVNVIYYDDDNNEIEINDGDNINNFSKQKVTFKANKSGILYINTHLVSDDVEEDGLHSHIINTIRDDMFLDMGFFNDDEEYSFYLYKYTSLTNWNNIKYRFLNYDVAKNLCEKIINTNSNYKYNKNGYEVTVTSDKNCNLYIMTPNIKGLSYKLNDKNIQVNETLGNMIYMEIGIGENKLVASYKYPNSIIWLVSLCICVFIVSVLLVLRKFGLLKFFEKPIYYAMSLVFGIIVTLVYILGILFSLVVMFY